MDTTAGIDFGSTLIKACWRVHGMDRHATVGGGSMIHLLEEMHQSGVRKIRLTGIGSTNEADSRYAECHFEIVRAPTGAVDDEIRLQAAGARLLLERTIHMPVPRKMIVASIGTGVSYTKVSQTFLGALKAKRSPLGSAHGGGTIMGLARLIGAKNFQELEAAAAKGTPADLLVRDQLPDLADSDLGKLVIAHFTKAGASFEDNAASVFSFAAASIAKDLAVLTAIPFSPKDIVVVGRVSASQTFRDHLWHWASMLKGRLLHFPKHGEYAAAVGAWADISE